MSRLTCRASVVVRAGFALALSSTCLLFQPASAQQDSPNQLTFNRDIRPILSNHCYQCHGPDHQARQGGLRLDVRDQALTATESGAIAIVPGNATDSHLVERILSTDPSTVMPPPEIDKRLTSRQKELLAEWINKGAAYEVHWAFVPPERPNRPDVNEYNWARNQIDEFILARLAQEGLRPSPSAELPTLLRRLALDLTGLPPTPSNVDAFVREMSAASESSSADAVWQRWVDHYLDSPHYGERMAVDWLDAARFADTNGYQVDRDRQMYLWRDWVIQAFNTNMPFDQFTVEQLAGDLLPDATITQKIATGFHRNHMLNEEGGVIPDEFLAEYCADRVETTAAVWLGQTFNCARCHDHKFDPFTQRDFYGLYAFFHNVAEKGIGNYSEDIRSNAPPFLRISTPELDAKLESLNAQLADAQKALAEVDAQHPERKPLADRVAAITKQRDAAENEIPSALIMAELAQPRETRILIRGVYTALGEVVTADTPASLPAMIDGWPRNRMGLAQWLMDPKNPLTARVTMNRFWQSLFGVGLVRTSEDFGTQGEPPSHPELLDWLATEFVSSGWDVKHMIRLMVSSAAYRQSSRSTRQLTERDPENRLLARGPRFRLQSEFIRDQALAASGLLVTKIGGPSVKPYHPPGLYEQVTAGRGTNTYVQGSGEDLYRRSLYTYWKRSVPNPAMLVFDAPFREACILRRPRTNTPLQALNLMNDPTYVEAAKFLAARILTEVPTDIELQ